MADLLPCGDVTLANTMFDLLRRGLELDDDKAGAIALALNDTLVACQKIYIKIIPEMLEDGKSKEELLDLLWDIREEFREIDYHIHDAELTEL